MNKIGFIGGGKMATAVIQGIINSKLFLSDEIIVSAKHQTTLDKLKVNFGVNTVLNNVDVVKNADIIILSVKPFILRDILSEIKPYITENHIVMSIAAGISIKTIEEMLGNVPVIRIMPNTPSLVNEGMSAVCKGNYALCEHSELAVKIFKSVGKVIEADEKYINIITAISGSGPAFYYYIINEIAKSGEKHGLDYDTCLRLSAQTALGSAKMILDTNISPEQLIVNVTTPGGCTAVGNEILKDKKISEILQETIDKTAEKAFELGVK